MSARLYVGCRENRWELFRSAAVPTQASHGSRYGACIGPFRTVNGAKFMAHYGRGNPHCITVMDAERLAVKYAEDVSTLPRAHEYT